MSRIPFELDLPPGLNSDDSTFAAPGRWADCDNVRFVGGKPQTLGKYVIGLFEGTGAGVSAMLAFKLGDWRYFIFGSRTTLSVSATSGSAGIGVTAIGGVPAGVANWSLAMYGKMLMANPAGGTLYSWSPGDPAAAAIDQAPDEIICILTTPQRQVLALGCSEESSGTFNGLCIRGCDLEDFTDWTSSPTNNAFEHILEGTGEIVGARIIGAYVAVWTDAGLYLGQFLGDPMQTYRFDLVAESCGLVGPNAVTVMNQTAYWVSHDLRVYAWVPGAAPVVIPCPISLDFRRNVTGGELDKAAIVVGTVSKHNEIWIFYPDSRDGGPSETNTRYIAFSTIDGSWFRGRFGRSAILDNGIVHSAFAAHTAPLLMTEPGGGVALQEMDLGTSFEWSLETADQYVESGKRRVMIDAVTPDFGQHEGTIHLNLSMRDRPHGAAVTKGPYMVHEWIDGPEKKNVRASGRLAAINLSGAVGSTMRLGKFVFDIVALGGR